MLGKLSGVEKKPALFCICLILKEGALILITPLARASGFLPLTPDRKTPLITALGILGCFVGF